MTLSPSRLWLLLLAGSLFGCRGQETALLLRVELDPSLSATQLRVSGDVHGDTLIPPTTRPEQEGAPLEALQTLRLVTESAVESRTLHLHVEALRSGEVVARESRKLMLEEGAEVAVDLRLTATADVPDGGSGLEPQEDAGFIDSGIPDAGHMGPGCAACVSGQACVDGLCVCTDASCPAGCCNGNECVERSLEACGTGGATCVACEPSLADNCSGEGVCRCGTGAPCEAGQRCLAGVCRCDGETCPSGCCSSEGVCRMPSVNNCGAGGATCAACDATRADTCAASGDCRCGGRTACAAGERCNAGVCVCDCPDGCCDGSTCRTRSFATCGLGGAACTSCDATTADQCSTLGACRCGSGPACGSGLACVQGACVCNAASCSGCCSGNVCNPGTAKGACGTGGAQCTNCKNAQCNAGSCG